MRANVYHGPGLLSWDEMPDPEVTDDGDAIVRVDATTICGTDLRVLAGEIPTAQPGRVLGHEAVGTVQQVGQGVRTIGPGDRVLVAAISACGTCRYCRAGRFGLCTGGGGWLLGHTFDGTQAEYVRVPFADTSAYLLPAGISDSEALMLADTVPAGYEAGVRRAGVAPGDVVAVVGAGPVGLAAIAAARLFSPGHVVAIDRIGFRLDVAKGLGADVTVNNAVSSPADAVRGLTDGLGADAVIEAAGSAEAFELAVRLTRSGGTVASVAAHGRPAALHLEDRWARDITVTTALVDTASVPLLLRLLAGGQIETRALVTHQFGLGDVARAYDVAAHAADTRALKVVLSDAAQGLADRDAGRAAAG